MGRHGSILQGMRLGKGMPALAGTARDQCNRAQELPESRAIRAAQGQAITGELMPSTSLGDIEKHFWLTRSVARCMGLSLTEAMAEGQLSANEYAELVTRCRGADCSEKCAFWLAMQQSRATAAPEFCANAAILNNLT